MYVLGLYSDGNYFKISLISKKRGKVRVEFLKEFNKATCTFEVLKKSIEKEGRFFKKGVEVATALPLSEVFIKNITLPLVNQGQVYRALDLELSLDGDFLEGGRVYVPKLRKKEGETEVTLFAFTKESMENHLQAIEKLGVNPDAVSTISAAFVRFSSFCNLPKTPYYLFHFGWETSSIHFFDQGEILQEASFSIGFKHIIEAVQKDQLLLDAVDMERVQELFLTALEEKKGSVIRECFTKIEKSISRIQKYISDKDARAEQVDTIVFTGYSEFCRAIKSYIPQINMKELVPSHEEYTPRQLGSYAIEIGLALDLIQSDDKTLQLAAGDFTPKGQKIKAKKRVQKFFGALSLCVTAISISVYSFFSIKESQLATRYDIAIAKLERFTEAKAERFYPAKDNFLKNRKALNNAIKAKIDKDQIRANPILFSSISLWFSSFLPEGFSFDQIEYYAEPSGAQVKCVFKGEDQENRALEFKEKALLSGDRMLVDESVSMHKDGDSMVVKMQVKI